jgi:hypothetical protein
VFLYGFWHSLFWVGGCGQTKALFWCQREQLWLFRPHGFLRYINCVVHKKQREQRAQRAQISTRLCFWICDRTICRFDHTTSQGKSRKKPWKEKKKRPDHGQRIIKEKRCAKQGNIPGEATGQTRGMTMSGQRPYTKISCMVRYKYIMAWQGRQE